MSQREREREAGVRETLGATLALSLQRLTAVTSPQKHTPRRRGDTAGSRSALRGAVPCCASQTLPLCVLANRGLCQPCVSRPIGKFDSVCSCRDSVSRVGDFPNIASLVVWTQCRGTPRGLQCRVNGTWGAPGAAIPRDSVYGSALEPQPPLLPGLSN